MRILNYFLSSDSLRFFIIKFTQFDLGFFKSLFVRGTQRRAGPILVETEHRHGGTKRGRFSSLALIRRLFERFSHFAGTEGKNAFF